MTDLVRVWIVSADVPPEITDGCWEVLDEKERVRAGAYLNEPDRHQYVLAHGALRMLAGRELGVLPTELTWIAGAHGKPSLAPPWSNLHTSLSHSGDMVVAAVSAERPVGVDIQQLLPAMDTIGMSTRFFTPEEAEYVAAASDTHERADRFAHLWTRKEAVVKAVGGRLWPNLRMPVGNGDVVECAEPVGAQRVCDVIAPPGYRAAVALTGAEPFAVEAVSWPNPSS